MVDRHERLVQETSLEELNTSSKRCETSSECLLTSGLPKCRHDRRTLRQEDLALKHSVYWHDDIGGMESDLSLVLLYKDESALTRSKISAAY